MVIMAPSNKVVFIGNIAYGLTEEQITHLFGTVGQVLNFRLVYDKDTGRPKGYGFLEYADSDSAASAVRNLNGHEIMGRNLRVDYTNESGGSQHHKNDSESKEPSASHAAQPPPPALQPPPQQQPSALPTLPAGAPLPAGIGAPDAISRTLSSLHPDQLLNVLVQMRSMVVSEPAKATQLLSTAPQLAYAIFQALLLLGLVDTTILAQVVETQSQAAQVQPPPQQPLPYMTAPQPFTQQSYVPTPPQTQNYPPPQAAPYVAQPPQPQPQPDQAALVQTLLNMSQAQLDALPPDQRAQVMQIRAAYGAVAPPVQRMPGY